MADVQTEKGYTRIANTLCEALARISLRPHETQILWVILRRTYGWKRKDSLLNLDQLATLTEMRKSRVSEAVRGLLECEIITKNRNETNRRDVSYSLQKDYDQWKPRLRKTVMSLEITENRNFLGRNLLGDNELQTPKESSSKACTTTTYNHGDESILVITKEEATCWDVLESILGFPKRDEIRVLKLREYIVLFPHVDPVALCHDYAAVKVDAPLLKKAKPMSQLRQFFVHAKPFGRSLREQSDDTSRQPFQEHK